MTHHKNLASGPVRQRGLTELHPQYMRCMPWVRILFPPL